LKENNAMLKEHNSVVVVVSSIDDNDRVRKIGVNTGKTCGSIKVKSHLSRFYFDIWIANPLR
jgi:hypothetical protein